MKFKDWSIVDKAPADWQAKFQHIPRLARQVMWRRGLTEPEQIASFLTPRYERLADPFLFSQMEAAVELILSTIKQADLITVYGDYDADGVTATALMYETLMSFGAKANWYLPARLAEGYGLNKQAITKLARQGTKLLITVDCGTTNLAEIELAKQLGLLVIVIDHHQALAKLPSAEIILNPVLADETYPARNLSSAGVVYTLTRALILKTNNGKKLYLSLPAGWEKWLLDLVAISTIADMMPLTGENRILVKFGLMVLRKSRRLGLRTLFSIMGSLLEQADEYTIGFMLAPRINAAGRLHHASLALELLLTKDPNQAQQLAERLQSINGDRQQLTEMAVAEALEQVRQQGDQPAYTAYAPYWSPGILGLVAGRIADQISRPIVVMANNEGEIVGSGRSVPGFNIMKVMEAGRDYFSRFGGHPGACGFSLADPEQREEFQTWFRSLAGDQSGLERPVSQLVIDGLADFADFDAATLDFFETLGPYGIEHPRPFFCISPAEVLQIIPVGNQQRHLKLVVRDRDKNIYRCIAFRQAERHAKLDITQPIDLVIEASWNVWRGQREPQFKIIDLRYTNE